MILRLIHRCVVMLCRRISLHSSFTALPLKVGEKSECEPDTGYNQRATIRPGHPRKGALILRRPDVVTQCKQAHRDQKSQSVINHRASPLHGIAEPTRRLAGCRKTICVASAALKMAAKCSFTPVNSPEEHRAV